MDATDATVEQRTPLQLLVSARLRDLGLTYRGAAEASAGLLSHATFARLNSPRRWAGRVTGRTVAGLALALRLPEARIARAAAESIRAEDFAYYATIFRNLAPADQNKIIKLMDQLARERAREAAAARKAAQPYRR